MSTSLLFIHAISPLHAGTGQSAGPIDLAIAREKATGIPYLPGSSIKGVLRDRCEARGGETTKLFGPPTDKAGDQAGALMFGDARLVFLPVRSFAGTFAWVTSPLLLGRLSRDLAETGRERRPPVEIAQTQWCAVSPTTKLTLQQKVILEELDLTVDAGLGAEINSWAALLAPLLEPTDIKEADLQKRMCIVSDDVMSFLLQQATEVTARIRLDPETKTVVDGQLWYEEALPAEAILASLVLALPPKATQMTGQQAIDGLGLVVEENGQSKAIQFGGKATVGRGLCRVALARGIAPAVQAQTPAQAAQQNQQGKQQHKNGGRR